MKTGLILLAALLLPAIASAQPTPSDPDAPPPPPAPVIVNPPPDPAPAPTVVVNPPADPAPAPITVSVPPPTSYAPVAPEYEEVYDAYNAPMFTTGALVFAASYGTSVIVAASTDDERGNRRLYVPVVGPWLALNDRGSCDILKSSCDHETTAKVLLIADGVFQAAGILGMIDGILQPTTHRRVVRDSRLDTKVHIIPTAVHGDPGVGVMGRF